MSILDGGTPFSPVGGGIVDVATAYYAEPDDLRALLNIDSTVLDDIAATKLISRAEDRIDYLAGPGGVDATTGRRYTPTSLQAWRAAKLRDATLELASAEHADPVAFTPRTDATIKGPDFETTTSTTVLGGLSGPGAAALRRAVALLDAASLRRLTAVMRP